MANIQQQFLSELSDALSTDRKLNTCDREVQNYVDIQKDRLRKKGLLLDYEFTPRGHNPEGREMGREAKDEHYVAKMWTSTTKYTRLLQKNGKRINKKKMNADVWSVVINYLNGQNMGDEIYNCPNCGNPEKIKALTEGCPYCGTSFKMDELYPKVTAYNIVEDYSKEKKEMLKFYLIVSAITFGVLLVLVPILAVIFGGLGAVVMFMLKADPEAIMHMIMLPAGAVAYGIFTAPFMSLFIGGMILFGKLLIGAAKSAPLLATFASHKKFEEELKKYGQDYMQEYFMSQTVAKMKSAIYSEDARELPFYEGEALPAEMKDIVDVFFRGAMDFKSVEVRNDIAYVSADVYTEVLRESNGKARESERIFHVNMRKNLSKKNDLAFSISKFMCPTCGVSFNAYKHKNCPACGNAYKMEDADWVIDSIK
ncbi:MAG: hypothetical protein J6P37_03860 [Lachnospiraceae bacterium]|nr:hypothetical protein [Lachnospiraceae bacterium]